MGTITLEDVTKHYEGGGIVAVEDLSLQIDDAEFLVLLGPSGCGKSTTLRMIAGLESITSGEIRFDGEPVSGPRVELEPRERNVAMVFQNYALYPHMTVEENIGFGLRLSSDLSDDEIERKVREAAGIMDIDDLLDKTPDQLSGGQQQRVALGRAIVRDPVAFLFDEPLSNLDAKLRAHMRTELTRIQHDLDVTSVYVTHDQEEAMTMGDRIVVLRDGILQQVGTPTGIYDHPTNRFVAEFIGEPSMNTLDGVEFRRDESGARLIGTDGNETTWFDYPLDPATADRLTVESGQPVAVGVRPEDISVQASTTHLSPDAQLAEVDVVEPMGSDMHVYFEIDGTIWTARTGRVELEESDKIGYEFGEAALHLFDEAGRTLKSRGTGDDAYHYAAESVKPSQSVQN